MTDGWHVDIVNAVKVKLVVGGDVAVGAWHMLFFMQTSKILFWNTPSAVSCLENLFKFEKIYIVYKMKKN